MKTGFGWRQLLVFLLVISTIFALTARLRQTQPHQGVDPE